MTFRIGDNDRFVTLHNRYARVRSTQINTDNLSHNLKLLFRFQFIFILSVRSPDGAVTCPETSKGYTKRIFGRKYPADPAAACQKRTSD